MSCQEGTGIDELRRSIIRAVCDLPHVFDTLPESYFNVKQSLVERARNEDYIDYKRYRNICSHHKVTDKRDRDILLRFLHDLGNVLNFDDPDDPYNLKHATSSTPSGSRRASTGSSTATS